MDDLIARLESGEGSPFDNLNEADDFTRAVFGPSWTFADQGLLTDACNGSLDRAAIFVERMLPEWGHGYATGWYGKGCPGAFVFPPGCGADLLQTTLGRGTSPARALMAAALRALSPTPAPKEDSRAD